MWLVIEVRTGKAKAKTLVLTWRTPVSSNCKQCELELGPPENCLLKWNPLYLGHGKSPIQGYFVWTTGILRTKEKKTLPPPWMHHFFPLQSDSLTVNSISKPRHRVLLHFRATVPWISCRRGSLVVVNLFDGSGSFHVLAADHADPCSCHGPFRLIILALRTHFHSLKH